MIHTVEIKTRSKTELVDITSEVEAVIKSTGCKSGAAILYVPHTTAAITINENNDPSVAADIGSALSRLIPAGNQYSHTEGNADAHIKAAIIGSSKTVFFENAKIVFGSWQGIFFCEFDGPRTRKVFIKTIEDRQP
jgi:secondary thiamine-phosphate synthase enzyme